MIYLGTKELENLHIGSRQINRVLKGTQVVWENWKKILGNPYTRENLSVIYRTSSNPSAYGIMSEANWLNVMTSGNWAYSLGFHWQTAIFELPNYLTLHPTKFQEIINDKGGGGYSENFTHLNIYQSDTFGFQVSEDNVNYKNVYFTKQSDTIYNAEIDYETLGIEYVRYMRFYMAMQNNSFTPVQPRTCNLICTEYLQKGGN